MSCLPAWKKELLESRLAAKEVQLTLAYTSILESIPNSEVSEYEFDSGEGKQRVRRRAPDATLKLIEKLEKEIEFIYRQLNGYGLVNFKTRRIY